MPQSHDTTLTQNRIDLGKKLTALREKLNSTQVEMARTLGVLPGYLSHIERAYNGISFDRAAQLVERAYKEFSAPYEAPIAPVVAQVAAPGEVEAEAVRAPPITRAEVSRRIGEFQREFSLRPAELAQLFGLSAGHEHVLRTGREGSSLGTRRKVIGIIESETLRRRGSPATTDADAVPVAPQRAEPNAETHPAVTVARGTAEDVLAAIAMDFKTLHRFMRLPDGSVLVVKGG